MVAKVIPVWVAVAVVAGMTAVSVGLSYLLRKKPKLGEATPNEFASNIVDTDAFVPVIVGKANAPIFMVFADTNPDDINELHIVGVFSHGEIESVEKIFFDNMQLVAKKTGEQLVVRDEYDNYVDVSIRRGAPGDINRPYERCVKTFKKWTSKHTSGMLASLYMVVRYNQDLFATVPSVFVLAKGKNIYDLRDGQTKWTDNPVLWILHYLTDKIYGKGLDINTEIDKASFIAEANYCDEKLNFPKAISPGKVEPRLVKTAENPLQPGTYYFKYSYCYGSTIGSENTDYYFYESNLSPAVSVSVTSTYGEVVLENIANSPQNAVTIKRIYRTEKDAGINSTYYLVKEIDYKQTTTKVTSKDIGNPFDNSMYGTGGLNAPSAAATASFTNFSGSGLQTKKKYRYKCTFVSNPGTSEGETIPSPASKEIKTTGAYNTVKLPTPDVKDDAVTHVRWYRTEGYSSGGKKNAEYYKVADVPVSTQEYLDKLSDAQLDHARTPPTINTLYSQMKRYTANGVLDTGDEQDSILEKLLSACRGRLYNVGGVYKIFIPKIAVAETFELTEDNIIGDWSFTILGMDKRPNAVRATYINPDNEWKSDTVVWPKADKDNLYLKDDNDFKKMLDIDLPFTTDRRMAEMICQTIRKEARNNIVVELTAMESARILKCGALVKVTHSLPGWNQKKFWVDGIGIFPNRTVRLLLVEYNEDDYVYETLTEDTLPGADTNLGDPFDAPDEVTDVTFTEEEYIDKNQRKYRLRVAYTDPATPFWSHSEVYLKIGNSSDATYQYFTKIDKYSSGVFFIEPIIEGVTYYVKIYSINTFGVRQSENDTTIWQHTVSNFIPPPDINAETISVSIIDLLNVSPIAEVSWDYGLVPTDPEYCKDFSHFVIGFSTSPSWGSAVKVSKTKTNWFLAPARDGSWYILLKAVDTAGNESNTAVKQFTLGEEGTWTTIINGDFSTGSHDGTERYNAGGGDYRLRLKQNMLSNPSFSANMNNWNTDNGNWKRVTNEYYSSPASAESTLGLSQQSELYTNNVLDTNIEILAGKTYAFTARVRCWQQHRINLKLELDSSNTAYSNYHSGSGQWELLYVYATINTVKATPKISVVQSGLPTISASYVDDCKYTRLRGVYTSAAYDRGVSAQNLEKIFKMQYTLLKDAQTYGKIYIDLGISADNINYDWYEGLESRILQATAKRYIKYRIRFENVFPDELLQIDEDIGGGVDCVLLWADVSADIADGSITSAKLADASVIAAKIADGAVDSNKLANLAVTAAKIADGAVDSNKLANLAVTAAKIADGAVGESKLANAAVTSNKLADLAVTAGKIADGAIDSNKLANLAVTAAKIVDGAVSTSKLVDSAITTPKIATNAVTALKIRLNDIVGVFDTDNGGFQFWDSSGYIRVNIRTISGGEPLFVISRPGYYATSDTANPDKHIFTNKVKGYLSYVDKGTRNITFNSISVPAQSVVNQENTISLNISEYIVRGAIGFARFTIDGKNYMIPLGGFNYIDSTGRTMEFLLAYDTTSTPHILRARRWLQNLTSSSWNASQITITVNWYLLGETFQ